VIVFKSKNQSSLLNSTVTLKKHNSADTTSSRKRKNLQVIFDSTAELDEPRLMLYTSDSKVFDSQDEPVSP
jgi:hypothetical protein